MKFKAIAEITVGQNITREKETNQKYYTNDDLIADLHAIPIVIIRNGIEDETPDANNHEIRAGDVLYSVVTSTAAIVSPQNDGKRLNQNIAKMTLSTGQLDQDTYATPSMSRKTFKSKWQPLAKEPSKES